MNTCFSSWKFNGIGVLKSPVIFCGSQSQSLSCSSVSLNATIIMWKFCPLESVHMFPRLRHTCFENHIIMKNKKSDRVKICAALNAAEYRKMKAKRQVKLSDEEEDEDLCPVDCVKEFRSNAELNAILEGAKKTDSLVVVDFYRTACGSCKYIEQGFTKLCKGAGDKEASVVFLKHNVMDEYEEQSEVAEHLKIKVVPLFHFYRDGELVEAFPTRDKSKIIAAICKHTSKSIEQVEG
eukprot:Gb_18396 [translate_table: standard]